MKWQWGLLSVCLAAFTFYAGCGFENTEPVGSDCSNGCIISTNRNSEETMTTARPNTGTQITAEDIVFTGKDYELEKAWILAKQDVLKNYCMDTRFGKTFAAGAYGGFSGWRGLAFNRDTTYAGLLALNSLYPEEMLTSYKTIRRVRLNLGWNCYPDFVLHGIDGVIVHEDLSLDDFRRQYCKASAINKTDDVCWLWGAYDLLVKTDADEAEWSWLYETGKECFEKLYTPFWDEARQLYFGQPTFIDVGANGYPESFGFKTEEARNNGVWVYASSTNSLYYKALCIMAEAAECLGESEESKAWKARAEILRKSMCEKLRFADGTFMYFLHRDGHPEERREVLGTAFPVLTGVVTGEDAKRCVAGYRVTEYGADLITPFYPGTSSLHNNSTWPFADTFLLLAKEQAEGRDYTELNLEVLKNMMRDGHMCEFRNTRTNTISGQTAQLWSIAAYLNTVIRAGLTDAPKNLIEIY